MNLRTKKTLGSALSGAALLGGFTAVGLSRPQAHFSVTPLFAFWVLFFAATTGYAWWFYGPSEKAVELRAKADAKKAARQASR